jgi:dTDP-4-dehydrorhamnose reductase
MKSALLLGAAGQLGRLVQAHKPDNIRMAGKTHQDFDITDSMTLKTVIAEVKPDIVINCAAYTAVDKAESEPETAYRVNAEAPGNLAALLDPASKLIHLSTDFVFSKYSANPYKPGDKPDPVSVYGKSKLAGEEIILRQREQNSIILRVSWLYSATGRNFVTTMLRLMREGKDLNVIGDKFGTPTSAHRLADIIWKLALSETGNGIYHWSDRGVISWYDFAVEIMEQALQSGILDQAVKITSIPSAAYPTPAERPVYSALDSSGTESVLGIKTSTWQEELGKVLDLVKLGQAET